MRALLVALIVAVPGIAHAAKGVVAWTGRCDYFAVQTPMGFAVLEWYGGELPVKGAVVVGDFETYGMTDIHYVTTGDSTTVWVEEYFLSRSSAAEKLAEKCR
jgi:hypothetical protein